MDIAAIVLALLAGALSLLNSVYTTRVASRLEDERQAKSKAALLAELMARYRDPLLQASFDLQSRIYNIVAQGFLQTHYCNGTESTREYARENTLYVLADYLGWVEILRREVRFLDLGDEVANRAWTARLVAVRTTLLSDRFPPRFRVFNGQQRAIGEIMIAAGADRDARPETLGYAGFLARQQDPAFDRWFVDLRADLDALANEPAAGHEERLVALQHALVELIDILDPKQVRIPGSERRRLAEDRSQGSAALPHGDVRGT
jgi:hypothetical protein